MSLYASMNTAISGLTAQARALGNVADNVANSQTTGFKRTDTNFVSYITRSNQQVNQPGSVIARPDYTLTVQGTVTPSDNPLAMAIAGQGMFAVGLAAGRENGEPTFDARNFYTRAGDFNMDRDGYLVNGQGYYLQGWATDTAGQPASVSFAADFGQGPQTISLNFGRYGETSGLTQFDGQTNTNEYSQDGVPLGAFSSVSLAETGDLTVNYDNGQSRTIGRVPIVSFADPDKLQKTDGQAYLRTNDSGEARVNDPSTNGSGKIVTSSLEGSNVDLASEFSKLILAQRAYSANTKIVTVSDELLQDTLNMRR